MSRLKGLLEPTVILMFFLGFSSGLPLALVGGTLQFWYNAVGVSLVGLGLLSLLGQPYTFKFIWAPLMDRFTWPLLGRRRGWMCFTQLILFLLLVVMAFLDPAIHPFYLGGLAFLLAFFSASQDITVDAYRTDVLSQSSLGLGNAFYTAGYRIAMLVSGGLALIAAGLWSFKVAYLMMAALMLIGIFATLLGKEPAYSYAPTTMKEAVVSPFKVFLEKPLAWFLLIFILFYKLGDAFSMSLLGPFIVRIFGLSLTQLGMIYKTVGLASTLLGVFLGGIYLKRLGIYRALLLFGFLQGFSILSFIFLLHVHQYYPLLVVCIGLENMTAGMGTVAFLSFLMNLCDHRYTSTQFALLSSLSAIGRVYIGPLAGFMVQAYGWQNYFLFGFFLSLPGLFLLWWIQNRVEWPFAAASPSATA